MKIVLTGATGFVGSHVLTQLLEHPAVETVTCVTRRPLAVRHAKMRAIVHDDFTRYHDVFREHLEGHAACIWTLGGKATEAASRAEYERTTHDFTLAFANEAAAQERPFRFCYLSGMGAAPSESAILPWERETRHLKGRTERDLAALAKRNADFSAYSFRPGGILPRRSIAEVVLAPIVVRVDVLAAAMIRVALEGSSRSVISNRLIKKMAH